MTGIEKIVSIINDNDLSKKPPKYPLTKPNGRPNPIAKIKDKNTISIAIFEPCKVLKQTSLPNRSVPHKWFNEGGSYISLLKDIEKSILLFSSNILNKIAMKRYKNKIINPVFLIFAEILLNEFIWIKFTLKHNNLNITLDLNHKKSYLLILTFIIG